MGSNRWSASRRRNRRPGRENRRAGVDFRGPSATTWRQTGPVATREDVMKYLCMIFYEQKRHDALSRREYDALKAESLAYDDELRQSGRFLAAQALESIDAATTIRLRDGRPSTTDGPFAETKEHIGGFILIEARDLNEAIQLASRIPPARLGGVEVRPVKELRPT
jgi:hypothetical protein